MRDRFRQGARILILSSAALGFLLFAVHTAQGAWPAEPVMQAPAQR
jgi:hypothetical protein